MKETLVLGVTQEVFQAAPGRAKFSIVVKNVGSETESIFLRIIGAPEGHIDEGRTRSVTAEVSGISIISIWEVRCRAVPTSIKSNWTSCFPSGNPGGIVSTIDRVSSSPGPTYKGRASM